MTPDEKEERCEQIQEDLGICGCGNPKGALDYVEKILALCDADKWDELDTTLDAFNDMRGCFVLYALDNAGYIEHGSTIYYSWLTPVGEAALRFLQVDRHV